MEDKIKGYIYILQSDNGKFYIGSTQDVASRFKKHLSGNTHTTQRMKNIKLVFSQEFNSIEITRKIERKIKSWKRKDFIEKIIKDGFIEKIS